MGKSKARDPEKCEDQEREAIRDVEDLADVKRSESYLKILTEDRLPSILGPIFDMRLRGMKGKGERADTVNSGEPCNNTNLNLA